MDFYKLCAVILICSLISLIISHTQKELTVVISACLYIMFATHTIRRLSIILDALTNFLKEFFPLETTALLKAIGMLIICSISIYICDATGQKGLSSIIETLCFIEVFIIFFPILKELFLKNISLIGV